MPENVTVFDIDVDDSFDLYAWMKTKKQVNGIPVLLFIIETIKHLHQAIHIQVAMKMVLLIF